MKPREFLRVDPAKLHLPGSRRDGADPGKLQRQLNRYGKSIDGMPPPEVKRRPRWRVGDFRWSHPSDTRRQIFARHVDHRRSHRGVARGSRQIANGWRKSMKSESQTRLELLAALAQLSFVRPEWRLGQTLANLAMTAGRMEASGIWDLEDDEALAAAKTLLGARFRVGISRRMKRAAICFARELDTPNIPPMPSGGCFFGPAA